MAINLRKFETESEFNSAYTGGDYVEPWVSYVQETSGVVFSKVHLRRIEIKDIEMVGDVPASGGTVNKDNCTYIVNAVYSDMSRVDVTSAATVTGSLVVPASQVMERHSAGTLTLTAEYSGLTGSANVTVYQEESVSYLKFNIISGGVIAFGAVPMGGDSATGLTIEYKKNDGEWTILTSQLPDTSSQPQTPEDVVNAFASKFSVNSGDVVMFRGNNQAYAFIGEEDGNFNVFLSTASFNVEGNIMSLIDGDNYGSLSVLTAPATFAYLFSGCYKLVSAQNLLLPATGLTENCYGGMFISLFQNFGIRTEMELVSAPALPATTLASGCYDSMFAGCTSLTGGVMSIGNSATTIPTDACGYMFSGCESLTTAPELPATTLAASCYECMFEDCTSLAQAPALPATTLAERCYYEMFAYCTSLTTAPSILPASTLTEYCYYYMFQGCTSLTTAPSLPATTLAESCYGGMFDGCQSLTTAPALPATTLTDGCYQNMLQDCTSLTTAPELPATTLADYCYSYMFNGCTSLNYIKCLATDISASNCTTGWVDGLASTGTFVKNTNMSSWGTGISDIPSGWTVQDAQ